MPRLALPGDGAAERGGEIALRLDGNAVELEPVRHRAELASERSRRCTRRTGLEVRGLDAKHAGRAIRLEIDPRDEGVAEQEREHVVAVHALVLRRVELESEAHAEQ